MRILTCLVGSESLELGETMRRFSRTRLTGPLLVAAFALTTAVAGQAVFDVDARISSGFDRALGDTPLHAAWSGDVRPATIGLIADHPAGFGTEFRHAPFLVGEKIRVRDDDNRAAVMTILSVRPQSVSTTRYDLSLSPASGAGNCLY